MFHNAKQMTQSKSWQLSSCCSS